MLTTLFIFLHDLRGLRYTYSIVCAACVFQFNKGVYSVAIEVLSILCDIITAYHTICRTGAVSLVELGRSRTVLDLASKVDESNNS